MGPSDAGRRLTTVIARLGAAADLEYQAPERSFSLIEGAGLREGSPPEEVANVKTLGWIVDLVRWGEPWDIEEDEAG